MGSDLDTQDTLVAAQCKAEVLKEMKDWRNTTHRLARVLSRFDRERYWEVLSPRDEDGNLVYTCVWDFFKFLAPEYGLSARYFYTIRDQGKCMDQQGLTASAWSGAALTELAKLNDDAEKQSTAVRSIKEEKIEKPNATSDDGMEPRGTSIPTAKVVREHVAVLLPPKPGPSTRRTEQRELSAMQDKEELLLSEDKKLKLQATVADLEWCMEVLCSIAHSPPVNRARTHVESAIAHLKPLTEKTT